VLDAAVHLADDLHGLTRLVVEREEKNRRIHHARSLVIESAEQLREVASAGSEGAEPARKFESHAKLRLACARRVKSGSACLDAQRLTSQDDSTTGEKGQTPLSLFT